MTSTTFKTMKILGLMCLVLKIVGCKSSEPQGIEIGDTLLIHQDLRENKEMVIAISLVLKGDETGVEDLIKVDCGGGSGCYDLGFVMSQLVQKLGEHEFVKMVNRIEKEKLKPLESLLVAGLEYGDNDKDGKPDGKKLKGTFPQLAKFLNDQSNSN